MISYSAAISACESGKRLAPAQSVLYASWCCCLVPIVVSYCATISACEKSQQWEASAEVFLQWFSGGILQVWVLTAPLPKT